MFWLLFKVFTVAFVVLLAAAVALGYAMLGPEDH